MNTRLPDSPRKGPLVSSAHQPSSPRPALRQDVSLSQQRTSTFCTSKVCFCRRVQPVTATLLVVYRQTQCRHWTLRLASARLVDANVGSRKNTYHSGACVIFAFARRSFRSSSGSPRSRTSSAICGCSQNSAQPSTVKSTCHRGCSDRRRRRGACGPSRSPRFRRSCAARCG